jgi:hypothetical protein
MKKMEAEMEQVFEMKVQEKMQKLKDIEADVSRSIDTLNTIVTPPKRLGLGLLLEFITKKYAMATFSLCSSGESTELLGLCL